MKKININRFAAETFSWDTYELTNVKRNGNGELISITVEAILANYGYNIDTIYEVDANGNTSWATSSWTIEDVSDSKVKLTKTYTSDTSNIKGMEVHNWSENYSAALQFNFTVIDSDNKTTYITKDSGTAVLKGNVVNNLSTYDWNNAPSIGAVRNYFESGSVVQSQKEWLKDLILETTHPIGSLEINTSGINPSEYLGGGWESFGSGRTLVGVDSSDSDFNTAEETGGEKTHTLTTNEIPAHTHGSKSLVGTWANWGEGSGMVSSSANGYKVTGIVSAVGDNNQYGWGTSTGRDQDNTSLKIDATHEHNSVGGGQTHNNLQPYITVYFWKRIS
jgi:microcystin-dependent protein